MKTKAKQKLKKRAKNILAEQASYPVPVRLKELIRRDINTEQCFETLKEMLEDEDASFQAALVLYDVVQEDEDETNKALRSKVFNG